MNPILKSNLKRIGEILLIDDNEIDDPINEDLESDSDDSDYEAVVPDSDDTSTDEYISSQYDSSDSDVDQNNSLVSQPSTLEKNEIVWSIDPNPVQGRIGAANIMKKKAGCIAKVHTILDCFKLFITNEILDVIVLHTNRYAERYFDQLKTIPDYSGIKTHKNRQWKSIDRIELESFIALLIQSGLNHSNHDLLNELWDISQSRPIYRATMSLQRFKYILQFLRFDDRYTRDTSDRLSP
ncbi:unnamed protein product, partial [Adineta steineri]